MEPLQAGDPRQLGSFRLLGRLGAGGMGRVYLARSPGGRTVAVKVVHPHFAQDADFRLRFRQEARVAQAVSGRYTAPVVDADTEGPVPWLATAYVLGPDLTDVVDKHGALPERTLRALGAGLAAALQEIHAAGLIHRDLKPSNVLLAADVPRVIDFGIARAVDGNRMTQTGVVVGSPGYMPPEQALGREVGAAGDVFSLGAVLAFAATGHNAWGNTGSHAAMLYNVVHGAPELNGVPTSLLGLVRACLLKDPAQRPAPAELVAALAPQGLDEALADWLPSAVSSTIARHAAGILDLEAPGTEPPAEPGPAAPPPPAYGPAPTGAPAPGSAPTHGTPGHAPTQVPPSGGSPRRRVLGLAAAGAAVVAVAGGAGAWALTRDAGGRDAEGSGGRQGPEPETFSTPPEGVAPQPLWHRTVPEDSLTASVPPAVHEDLLLISAEPLVAYEVSTGKPRWTKKDANSTGNPVLLRDGTLYLRGDSVDGTVVGRGAGDGRESWRSRLGEDVKVADVIAVDDKQLYATVTDYSKSRSATDFRTGVAGIDRKSGKQVWLQYRDWGTDDYDVRAVVSGGFLVYTDSRSNMTVRSTATGAQLWTRKIGSDLAWAPTVAAGLVFVPGDELRAYDVESGQERWKLSPRGRRGFKNPVAVDGVLYVRDLDRGLWAVDPAEGSRIWLNEDAGDSGAESDVVVHGGHLYASGMDRSGVVALDRKTGEHRWTYGDSADTIEPWRLTRSGARLLATHGTEIYALPAV
ncbi:serine/threonine-protein kinase [Streptomyces sp. SCSIO ZS0520]|uniref:serine/threonine-protein kinase n=1 Tax=Streptomyces sp. SCSIO ZS0520 TaxID=2892996 RepID=UPI0021D921EE|nr:serine/threonine-protein kinase [Streptomyces sp. SCSIO ZS0520]